MSRRGDYYENRVAGERVVVLVGDEDGNRESALVHLTVRPGGAVSGEHVHPSFQERFKLLRGKLATRIDGVDGELSPGEEATVAANVPHDWWNTGESEASVLVELRPPEPRFEQDIATRYGLANDGRTKARDLPSPPQLALIGAEYADVIRFTKPPYIIQRALFGVLGAIGRMRGYQPIYPQYLSPHGQTTPDPEALTAADLH